MEDVKYHNTELLTGEPDHGKALMESGRREPTRPATTEGVKAAFPVGPPTSAPPRVDLPQKTKATTKRRR
jgi:hypothetical protein